MQYRQEFQSNPSAPTLAGIRKSYSNLLAFAAILIKQRPTIIILCGWLSNTFSAFLYIWNVGMAMILQELATS